MVGMGRVKGADGARVLRRLGRAAGCMGGIGHPWDHGVWAVSHHVLLDLAVRHGDAQRSLSWGEERGRGEGSLGSGLSSPMTPEAASGATPPGFENGNNDRCFLVGQ